MPSMIDRFSAYDPFAWIYNQSWGEEYHGQIDGVLQRAFYPHIPVSGRVLDLCCGAGHVTQQVASHGFRVIGLDGSAEMLRYAQGRVPDGEFLCADARDFALSAPVDGVLSTYDSLNHIMSRPELERVFRCVRTALAPERGVFFFDMNADEAYTEPWTHIGSSADRQRHWVAHGAYDPATRVAACEVEEMWRGEEASWNRRTFALQQRCYSVSEVLDSLTEAGFRTSDARSADTWGMTGPTGEGRVFYLATP